MRFRAIAWFLAAVVGGSACQSPTPAPEPTPGEPPIPAPAPAAAPAASVAATGPAARPSGRLPWFRTRLANGLTVIIEEVRSRPVVWVSLEVLGGSRDERPDEFGGAHFLEHVFYLGTPTRAPRALRDEIQDRGGQNSALTDYDRTEYWAVCRTEDWRLALNGLADGARNALVDAEEVAKEHTVIFDELRERIDNPQTFGNEELSRLAFQPHAYARRRAGELDEVQRLTRDHLHGIYRRHYRPDHFVLIITGDVDTTEALAAVEAEFGDMPNPSEPLHETPFVAPATGFEYAFFERPTEQTYVQIGCPAPGMAHADAAAVDMMTEFLRARLYTDLVLTQKVATSVSGGVTNYRDLGLLQFTITPTRHSEASRVEQMAYGIIAGVAKIPTGREDWDEQAELGRYQRNQRLSMAFDQQDASARGGLLAWGATMGTLEHLANYAERLDAVSLADVGRCARTYCAARHLNVVVVGPGEARASDADIQQRQAALDPITFDTTPNPDWHRPAPTGTGRGWSTFTLPTGLRVLIGTAPEFPLVSVGLFTPGGSVNDPLGREGRGWLANSMLMVGADAAPRTDGTMGAAWDRSRFARTINALGNRFQKSTAREYSCHALTVTQQDLRTALDMMSAAYVAPNFPDHEVSVEIEQVLGALRMQADSLYETAMQHARRLVYGPHHPYAQPTRGTLDAVPALTRRDCVDARFAGITPEGAVLVLYGNVTAREGYELARAAFGHWDPRPPAGVDAAPLADIVPEFDAQRVGRFEYPMDKEQALVVVAAPAVTYGSDAYPAADLGRRLLSEWAFRELIYEKKLAYSAGCTMECSMNGGGLFAWVQCNPEKRELAVTELRALVRRLVSEPLDPAEFARVKQSMLGSRPLQLQRGMSRVFEAGAHAVLGLDPDYTETHLAAIAALTPEQLQAAVQQWLDPERLTVVLVHREAPHRGD